MVRNCNKISLEQILKGVFSEKLFAKKILSAYSYFSSLKGPSLVASIEFAEKYVDFLSKNMCNEEKMKLKKEFLEKRASNESRILGSVQN